MTRLRQRLDRLREKSTPNKAPLSERIQRLRPGATPPKGAKPAETALNELGAEPLAPGLVLIERRIPLETRHGRECLQRLTSARRHPELQDSQPAHWLFIDTETTGLSGGSGTQVFLLGLARLEGSALILRQYLLTAFQGERALLEHARDWLVEKPVLISYNGKSFDIPLLVTRSRLAGVPDAFGALEHVDLLHMTRRAFARTWPDCRLGTAETRLLGFERSDDLPGSQAPAAWFDFIRRGDARRLGQVATHNQWDLISLAALMPTLAEVHADPTPWQADVAALARAELRRGREATAFELLWRCREQLDEAAALMLAQGLRRRDRTAEAQRIWERLAVRGEPRALEALAKHLEHVRHDYASALACAQHLPEGETRRHRLARLREKSRIHRSRDRVIDAPSAQMPLDLP